jgi:hypothetical protein
VSPIIDSINDENFGYYIGDLSLWGGFDTKMIFHWYKPPLRELERVGYDNSMPMRYGGSLLALLATAALPCVS